jgi:predicted amidohydrolase YtcJ
MKPHRIKKAFTLLMVVLFAPILMAAASRASAEPLESADMILFNGTVITLDENQPEAEALAIRSDRILAVGSNEKIKPYATASTSVIDLKGMFAMPGFIEGHGHFLSLGYSLMRLDLTHARNWSEIVRMVQTEAKKAKPGEWILGSGWHQEKWDRPPSPQVEGYPVHQSLSSITPDNPVLLTHASGHAAIANAKALGAAGVTKETADPPGGRILEDLDGNPTGVLLDTAQGLIEKVHEESQAKRPSEEIEKERIEAVELAEQESLSNGITSFQDASSSFETIEFFKTLAEEGRLDVRLWVMIRESRENLEQKLNRYRLIDVGDHRLTVRAVKAFMDGALGSHTAWLLKPYSDLPSSSGLNVDPLGSIQSTARLAIQNDFQLCVHAIGDRANREVLDIFETVFRENPGKRDLRWRIEHAQHISSADIPRFAKLGVLASMQPIHAVSDGPWVIKRLGKDRAEEGAYVWRKLIASGAGINSGTDAPVESVNPIANFHAAVTRKLPDGTAFYPDQRMSREEALKSYTINNAYAAFEEGIKGSLEVEKLADITVLSQNILTVPEDEILKTDVVYTIVGGKAAYRKK